MATMTRLARRIAPITSSSLGTSDGGASGTDVPGADRFRGGVAAVVSVGATGRVLPISAFRARVTALEPCSGSRGWRALVPEERIELGARLVHVAPADHVRQGPVEQAAPIDALGALTLIVDTPAPLVEERGQIAHSGPQRRRDEVAQPSRQGGTGTGRRHCDRDGAVSRHRGQD